MGPSTGEAWQIVEALIDAVDLSGFAKGGLAGDNASVTMAAGNDGRPGDGVAIAKRIP